MTSVTVTTQGETYDILLDPDLISSAGAKKTVSSIVASRTCMIVGDWTTLNLFKEPLENTLKGAGALSVAASGFEPGEQAKQLSTVERLYHEGVEAGLTRESVVFALGGGVPGDTAGFFAATYLRGVPFVQIPTSLVAMVDSSVGGKVGVDLPEGKNLVGSFYQPRLVLADLSTLDTLPERERKCGLAEIVKTALLFDPELFRLMEKEVENGIPSLNARLYENMIARCCEWKASVVREDEKEKGKRALLNYGHTFGHALEVLCGYATYNHGEAIAIGMAMAADFAVNTGLCSPELAGRQNKLLERLGLPATCSIPGISADDVLQVMYRDKKVRSSCLRLVLPRELGHVEIRETTADEHLKAAIAGRLTRAS